MKCPNCNHEFEPPKRGTRLPADWKPSDELFAWAVKKRGALGVVDTTEQIEMFCDFWHSKPGKDGTKLDWDATFRNWIRSARLPPRRFGPPEPTGRKPNPPAEDRRRFSPEKRAENIQKLGDLFVNMVGTKRRCE